MNDRKQGLDRFGILAGSSRSIHMACLVVVITLAAALWPLASPAVGQVEIGDGEGSLRISGGCVQISGGGRILSVGTCQKNGEGDEPSEVPEGAENTIVETTDAEQSVLETSVPEEISPMMEDPESTAPESVNDEDDAPEATSPGTTELETTVVGTPGEDASEIEEDRCPEPPNAGEAIRATVDRAVDGDTLEIEGRIEAEGAEPTKLIRLIGADSPELVGEDGNPQPYAEESANFTAGALDGEEVWLVAGQKSLDEYGRQLAYVWTSEGGASQPELFNLALVEAGLAEVMTIAPDDRYSACFEAALARAEEDGVGIHSGQYGDGSANPDVGEKPDTPASTQYIPEDGDSPEVEAAEPDEAVFEQYAPPDVEVEAVIETTTTIPDPNAPETTGESRIAPTEGATPETTEMSEETSAVLEAPAPPPETLIGGEAPDESPSDSVLQPLAEPIAEEPATLSIESYPDTDTPSTNASDHLTVLPDTGGWMPDKDSLARLFWGLGLVGLGISMFLALHARRSDCDSSSEEERAGKDWKGVVER